MSAVRKNLELSKLHSGELLDGYDVVLSAKSYRRVKLRRALNRSNPLGVTIMLKEGNQLSRIEQFDISPKLDPMTRSEVEGLIVEAYVKMTAASSFEQGVEHLKKLHRQGLCISCEFKPVS